MLKDVPIPLLPDVPRRVSWSLLWSSATFLASLPVLAATTRRWRGQLWAVERGLVTRSTLAATPLLQNSSVGSDAPLFLVLGCKVNRQDRKANVSC